MRLLLDTNPIILSINNGYSLTDHTYLTSIITEMELLSYSGLSVGEENVICGLLKLFEIIDLNLIVKDNAIMLRRKYGLKLPDSIIAATALTTESKLVTADKQLFKISEIEIIDLEDII